MAAQTTRIPDVESEAPRVVHHSTQLRHCGADHGLICWHAVLDLAEVERDSKRDGEDAGFTVCPHCLSLAEAEAKAEDLNHNKGRCQ